MRVTKIFKTWKILLLEKIYLYKILFYNSMNLLSKYRMSWLTPIEKSVIPCDKSSLQILFLGSFHFVPQSVIKRYIGNFIINSFFRLFGHGKWFITAFSLPYLYILSHLIYVVKEIVFQSTKLSFPKQLLWFSTQFCVFLFLHVIIFV